MRTFYLMAITQTFSLIGSRMTNIALAIQIFKDTDNATPLMLAAFFAEIPAMLGGSLAGVFADRYDRRRVMVAADAGSALATVLLMVSFISGSFQLWHLYVVAFLQGTFGQLQGPAADASVTMLVPDGQRDRANAIRQMAFPLAGVVAPVLAANLYVHIGLIGVMLVDLTTFLIAITVISRVHIPRPPQTDEGLAAQGTFWKELKSGFVYLWNRRILFWLVIYTAFINFMLNGPLELAIPYLMTISGDEALAGLLFSGLSLGALTGAVLIAVWNGTSARIHTIMPATLFAGAMFLIVGAANNVWVVGAAFFFLMIPLPLNGALFMSILQAKTPPDMQGRVFATTGQILVLATPFSFLITGPLVDNVLEPALGSAGGMRLVLFATGVIILISTALVYSFRSIRRMESTLPNYEATAGVA